MGDVKMSNNTQNYVVSFKGSNIDLFDYTGKIIRRFKATAEVVNAQVSGYGKNATIAVTMKNGKFIIYRADGTIVRRG